MIFSQDEHGIKGPIHSWATYHPIGHIKRLVITDNMTFYEELSGYDFYFASREGITLKKYDGRILNKVVKETIYGIRDLSTAKSQLLETYNIRLKGLLRDGADSKRLNKAKDTYDELLRRLEEQEVTSFSLIIEEKTQPIKETEVDKRFMKSGATERSVQDIDILSKRYGRSI